MSYSYPIYESTILYSQLTQSMCLFICLLTYVCTPTRKTASLLILMGTYNLFVILTEIVFLEVNEAYYLFESLFFFAWAVLLMLRKELKTPKDVNADNILLAFYKGHKGSFVMRFFELFGSSVKSMCILAGDNCVRLKENKETFEYSRTCGASIINNDDYYIVDTGTPHDSFFIAEMMEYDSMNASKCGLRIRCIEGVSYLLELIGEDFKPTSIAQYVPSIYFEKVRKL